MQLVVTSPFAGHKVGDSITDAGEVADVLASGNCGFVVQIAEQPEPETEPTEMPEAE